MNEDKCFELDFYEWYDKQVSSGYNFSLSKKEVKGLVNKLVFWYEEVITKQAELFKSTDGELDYLFIDELKKRLTPKEIGMLNCHYRGSCICGGEKALLVLYLPYKDSSYKRGIVYVDKFGLIEKCNVSGLEEVLGSFKKQVDVGCFDEKIRKIDRLDTRELDAFLEVHEMDETFRDEIIILAALTLMCSDNVSYEEGIRNARRLIADFNKYYGLELEINSYIYANGEKEGLSGFMVFDDDTDFPADKVSILGKIKKRFLKR